MSNIRDLKSFFRKKYKTARAEMSEEEKVLKDEKVCRNLLSTNAFERAEQVLLYSATPIEIETVGIFQNALNSGKKILYPRCLDNRLYDVSLHRRPFTASSVRVQYP